MMERNRMEQLKQLGGTALASGVPTSQGMEFLLLMDICYARLGSGSILVVIAWKRDSQSDCFTVKRDFL